MAYKQYCAALLGNVTHLSQAFLLEGGISHCEHFVNKQDFRLQMSGYSKGKAHPHATGVSFYWRINELLHFCKVNNVVEFSINFRFFHS